MNTLWFDALGMNDVERVGGKNASLGEMISNLAAAGVSVPMGFATTADAFRQFLHHGNVDARINALLDSLDVNDVEALAQAGATIRQWVIDTPLPADLQQAIVDGYCKMCHDAGGEVSVAVRSSATAEDLPDASFAGQQETLLNVRGQDSVLLAVKQVFASLYNDRAIAYRVHNNFRHSEVALSAGIQRMVRSGSGAAGVAFTLDTESGFREVVFVTAAYGLGETVVQGAVNPDEFYVYKPNLAAGRPAILSRKLGSKALKMVYADSSHPGRTVKTVEVAEADRLRYCLSDAQIEELARQALTIEQHYGRPMDIEWALDGVENKLYIVQARPETVKSRQVNQQVMERYQLKAQQGKVLTAGRAIGQKIGAGPARLIDDVKEMHRVQPGDVLVTDMTDPDWEPIMKRASAIVTNRGGRTCHAAIIARELGIPAVVGCGDATRLLKDGQDLTVSCAEGDTGFVYEGRMDFEVRKIATGEMPALPVKIMMNVGIPAKSKARISAYADPVSFYVDKLAEGISTLAAAFYPKPVIARMSDFKSNEYANLIAGSRYEPHEENPMIGFRGASRYISESFRACFELECRAFKKVRDEMGLTNVEIMIPFARTLGEAQRVLELLRENGLERGKNGLRVIMMCEIPSNAVLAEEFLAFFDGFSIGSNDMTQLTLGLDRDSGLIAELFDERDPAVKKMLHLAIQACRKAGKYVGICGQGPSDYPDLAEWLLKQGISSISLNPDTVIETWLHLAEERALETRGRAVVV